MKTSFTALCVDIGTSSLKAGLIDEQGTLLSSVREPYRRHGGVPSLREGSGVKADFTRDAGDWEAAFFQALDALDRGLSGQNEAVTVDAVCVSGNGPTLVPVGKDGESFPPLQWFDGRQRRLAGARSFFLPKAAWFSRERAAEYEKTASFLGCPEWLSWRLGAAPFTALPSPAYTPFYFDDAQISRFGLEASKFPSFKMLGEVTGTVSKEASLRFFREGRRLRFLEGVPIVAGGPDFTMALLGAGAVKAGRLCDRAGSSEGINMCVEVHAASGALSAISSLARAGDGDFRALPHVIEGLWNISVVIPESGSLFDRYRLETGQENRDYEEMLDEIIIRRGQVTAWEVLHTIALRVKRALDSMEAAGLSAERLTVSGGQARNAAWNQMKADITGRVVDIPEIPDGELAGGLCACLAAMGLAGSLEEAALRVVRIKRSFTPRVWQSMS